MKKIIFKNTKFTRFTALVFIMAAILSAIAVRLLILQIVNGAQYLEKANNKSIQEIPVDAPRGNITDINGKVLATSIQSYTLVFNPTTESDADFDATMPKVFKILDDNGEKITDNFELKIAINPDGSANYSFQFLSDDAATRRAMELRFKEDRGLDAAIKNKLYPKQTTLTAAEQATVG